MKKHTHDLIAEVPRSCSQVGITIGIDIGDVWSHYCTLNEDGEVVDRGCFRTNPSSVDKWFTDLPSSADRHGGGDTLDMGHPTHGRRAFLAMHFTAPGT